MSGAEGHSGYVTKGDNPPPLAFVARGGPSACERKRTKRKKSRKRTGLAKGTVGADSRKQTSLAFTSGSGTLCTCGRRGAVSREQIRKRNKDEPEKKREKKKPSSGTAHPQNET